MSAKFSSASICDELWKDDDLDDLELDSSGGEPGAVVIIISSSNGGFPCRRRVISRPDIRVYDEGVSSIRGVRLHSSWMRQFCASILHKPSPGAD